MIRLLCEGCMCYVKKPVHKMRVCMRCKKAKYCNSQCQTLWVSLCFRFFHFKIIRSWYFSVGIGRKVDIGKDVLRKRKLLLSERDGNTFEVEVF